MLFVTTPTKVVAWAACGMVDHGELESASHGPSSCSIFSLYVVAPRVLPAAEHPNLKSWPASPSLYHPPICRRGRSFYFLFFPTPSLSSKFLKILNRIGHVSYSRFTNYRSETCPRLSAKQNLRAFLFCACTVPRDPAAAGKAWKA